MNNEFSIIVDEVEYYYKDLDEKLSFEYYKYDWIGDLIFEYYDKLISDDDKIALFEQINFTGTIQDIKHLNKLKSK